MLNELLTVERGARQAGVEITTVHPDIQAPAKRISTLRVSLNENGDNTNAAPVPEDAELWTLRNHNKNSFPFVQVNPLLDEVAVRTWQTWTRDHPRWKPHEARAQLLQLAEQGALRREELGEWATKPVMAALRRRLAQVVVLEGTEAAALPSALRRFLLACDSNAGGDPLTFLKAVRAQVVAGLRTAATDAWTRCSVALLVGGKGALWVDADGKWPRSLTDKRIIAPVSRALTASESSQDAVTGLCGLTGQQTQLVSDTFPRADLPIIGPTILFSRFQGDPPKERYGRCGSETMPVGENLALRLAAAAKALTAPEHKGITWRALPGEAPKQNDLLLAFVEAAPDAPAVGMLAQGDDEEDYSEEVSDAVAAASDSIAAFEKRCERLIGAIRGKVTGDFRLTPVHVAVFRKVDPANRKVVFAGAPTVADLYDASVNWAAGERNVPPWLTLPVLPKGKRKPWPMAPPHIAPLGLIPFSKQLFLRRGTERQEVVGMPAAEALGLFLEPADLQGGPARRRVQRILRMVLARREALVSGTAHAQRRGFDSLKDFDRREALRTVTMLGLLTYKLGRSKEVYMSDTAFKLGQLLAAADIVHAGYCADVRSGAVPPSLLGNQVFTMAQTAPAEALAALCRRWKPYDGWAKKAARERDRADRLVASKDAKEQRRGWDIRKALRHAREMGPLAEGLGPALAGCEVNDTFRAELLLGYIAGLPKAQGENAGDTNETTNTGGEED